MFAKITPSKPFMESLADLDEVSVLHGPYHEPDAVVIDPVMGHRFDTALADFCVDAGLSADAATNGELTDYVDRLMADRAAIGRLPSGEILFAAPGPYGWDIGVIGVCPEAEGTGPQIVGLFTGANLCVAPDHRGRGLGRALTITRMLMDEGLPTWEHDSPCYSPEGARLISSALHDLQLISDWMLGRRDTPPRIIDTLGLDISIEALMADQEALPCP